MKLGFPWVKYELGVKLSANREFALWLRPYGKAEVKNLFRNVTKASRDTHSKRE